MERSRILLIDDSRYLHSLLSFGLERLATIDWTNDVGHGIERASDALQQNVPYNLMLFDIEIAQQWNLVPRIRRILDYRETPIAYFSWSVWSPAAADAIPVLCKRAGVLELIDRVRGLLPVDSILNWARSLQSAQ